MSHTKPKLYVVEGMDGTGKTTFAKWVEETYGFFYHHYGPPEYDNWVDEYLIPDLMRSRAWGDQIVDRGWVAEPMWAAITGREPLFTQSEYEVAADLYTKIFDFRILVLTDDVSTIAKRIVERGETPEDVEFALKAKIYYDFMPGAHVDADSVHSNPRKAFQFLDSPEYFDNLFKGDE